ncbi:TlpA family protein disulfide reductase [Streptomyces longwoodensis]|uniref:TlpA family protein disulfide reductase n=1 Tax=Streptomyces longwoodensis TaxID=68231 RepID=UPI003411C34B
MAAPPPCAERCSAPTTRDIRRPARRPRAWRAAALAAATGLALVACGSNGASKTSGSAAASSDQGQSAFAEYPPGKRPAAPSISGKLINDGTLDLADWRGKVVVINVWGSWCAPCRAEAPTLKKVSDATRKLGVRFVGFDTRDNDAAGRAFERTYKITYPSFRDPDGRLVLRFNGRVPVSAVPSTVLIDRSGRVAARIIGPTSYETLNTVVRGLAAEKPGTVAGTGANA